MTSSEMKKVLVQVKKMNPSNLLLRKGMTMYMLYAGKNRVFRRKDYSEVLTVAKYLTKNLKINLVQNLVFVPCQYDWMPTYRENFDCLCHLIRKLAPDEKSQDYDDIIQEFMTEFLTTTALSYTYNSSSSLMESMGCYMNEMFAKMLWRLIAKKNNGKQMQKKKVSGVLIKGENPLIAGTLEDLNETGALQYIETEYEGSEIKFSDEHLVPWFRSWIIDLPLKKIRPGRETKQVSKDRILRFLKHKNPKVLGVRYIPVMRDLYRRFHAEIYGAEFDGVTI